MLDPDTFAVDADFDFVGMSVVGLGLRVCIGLLVDLFHRRLLVELSR